MFTVSPAAVVLSSAVRNGGAALRRGTGVASARSPPGGFPSWFGHAGAVRRAGTRSYSRSWSSSSAGSHFSRRFAFVLGSASAAGVSLFLWQKVSVAEATGAPELGATPNITIPPGTKHYKYIIISHPRAVVAQSALGVITELDPDAEVMVVADRYNHDDTGGSRLYTSWLSRTKIRKMNSKDSGAYDEPADERRQMITSFTATGSKLDPTLPNTPTEDRKNFRMCTSEYVVKLDIENKLLTLSSGEVVAFGKCLLATGCKEAKLPGIPEKLAPHVTNLRKVKDFDRIQNLVREGQVKRIVVVGGGFLGCEVSSRLALLGKKKGVEVIHSYVEPGALYRYVPVYFSDYVTELLRGLGVVERPYHMVLSIGEPEDKKNHNLNIVVQGFEKTRLDCGHVVFAPTHLEGNVELAQQAGLEIDPKCGGVMVNAELMARTDVYVAGDTASYPDNTLGRRRMQSYDHSFNSGRLAARNMVLGLRVPYNYLPMITSSGGPLGLDVVVIGDIDSNMEMYSIAETHQSGGSDHTTGWDVWDKGVVYYLKDRRIVGAMLLNLADHKDDVIHLLRTGTKYHHKSDQGIPELETAIDFGLVDPICRHSSAKGIGMLRSNNSGREPK